MRDIQVRCEHDREQSHHPKINSEVNQRQGKNSFCVREPLDLEQDLITYNVNRYTFKSKLTCIPTIIYLNK